MSMPWLASAREILSEFNVENIEARSLHRRLFKRLNRKGDVEALTLTSVLKHGVGVP